MLYFKTVLALVLAINIALLSSSSHAQVYPEGVIMIVASDSTPPPTPPPNKLTKKEKQRIARLKRRIQGRFRVVSDESDFYFIGARRFVDRNSRQGSTEISIQGSQLIQNGDVYDIGDVEMDENSNGFLEIVGDIPSPEEGTFYNSQCTVMDGDSFQGKITQAICNMNLCFSDRGCLFFRSGGDFAFDPNTAAEDIPSITSVIIGGTKDFKETQGTMTVTVLSVLESGGDRRAVLQLKVSGR